MKTHPSALPTIRTDLLYHVGSLNPAHRVRPESLEADFLSASLCPESWEIVARIGGEETLILERPNSLYLDVFSLSDDQISEMRSHLVEKGLVEPQTWYKAWSFDGEADDWRYMCFADRERAEREVEDEDPEGCPGSALVEEVSGWGLTQSGQEALPRYPSSPIYVEDAISLLYVRLYGREMGVVGVHWEEDDDVEVLSAPRYAILPDALPEFTVTGSLGEEMFEDYVAKHEDGPSPA